MEELVDAGGEPADAPGSFGNAGTNDCQPIVCGWVSAALVTIALNWSSVEPGAVVVPLGTVLDFSS
jgi:hypothetical protein